MTIATATSRAALILILGASAASAQVAVVDPAPATPVFRVSIYASRDATASFNRTIADYFALRAQLQQRLPPVGVSNDPDTIWGAERALASLVRQARHDAEEGDIFTRPVRVEFRTAVHMVMSEGTCAAIMDDNPGPFRHRINGAYPKGRPLSTMPPNVLMQLPTLPEGLEYRFLGRHLILLDIRANMILDRIPSAIYRMDC
jgi:hypothetical protein